MQCLREQRRRFLNPIAARATRRDSRFTAVNQASQEGARRQDHAAGADFRARFRKNTGTRAACI